MPHLCAAPGCTADHARADRYCDAHRTRFRRHGHPLQLAVHPRNLEPFACRIASRLPEDGEVRRLLKDRWSMLTEAVTVTATTGTFRVPFGLPSSDRPATARQREAARRFLTTAASATPHQVGDLVIGLTILRAVHPETFMDETAFRFMIARRFLGLSRHNATTARTGSTTYRAYPAAVMLTLAEWLLLVFGEVAERMASVEVEEIDRTKDGDARLRDALARL